MKKSVLLCAGVFALATVGTGLAALDPTNPGLPQAWTFQTNEGYGLLAGLDGNPASAMCVDCHSVNPSQRIPQANVPVTNAAIGFTGGIADNAHWGSHVVINETAGLNSTNSGGGFTGGFGPGPRDAGEYFNQTGAWASGGTSKFGLSDGVTVTGSVLQGGVGYVAATANMICESCHSIYDNVLNAAADNDLLLDVYEDNADDTLCVVCHADGTGTYAGFHGNDNLPSFAGNTVRKKHHVLTGDVLDAADYGTGGTDSVMWAPSASNKLDVQWCTTAYANLGAAPAIEFPLDGTQAIAFRDACNVAGQGTRAIGAVLGDIAPVNAATMNCANCHRPHNAQSTGGAFLLRRGGTKDFAGKVGTGAFAGTTAADITYGLRRQADVDTGYATKVYGEYLPLCEGCHQGYGI